MDIFPGGTIERFTETLLIKGMSDESDRTSEDEKCIENTRINIHLDLRTRHTDRFKNIQNGSRNMTIDIEN